MNQGELPAPGPSLELPFARDHFGGPMELLDIDQALHLVLFGEALDQTLLMLEDAALEVVGRPRCRALPICCS
ncbi:MAG TPA: hypothetical protein VMD75_07350 [Candidatus Binataceae bacterium]|nr:hypothetical protein [Candidatus Binataceae bacterium]